MYTDYKQWFIWLNEPWKAQKIPINNTSTYLTNSFPLLCPKHNSFNVIIFPIEI